MHSLEIDKIGMGANLVLVLAVFAHFSAVDTTTFAKHVLMFRMNDKSILIQTILYVYMHVQLCPLTL